MSANEGRINDLSRLVIGGALEVAKTLGSGFLEKVYENALAYELRKRGLAVAQQRNVFVKYDGVVVGEYMTDLLVEDAVLVELKVAKALDSVHFAQCLNYLRATDLRLCLAVELWQTTPGNQARRAWALSHSICSRFLRSLRFPFFD